ncbi:hypothetical protein SMICM304S_02111 [Streptomyces microflavus]
MRGARRMPGTYGQRWRDIGPASGPAVRCCRAGTGTRPAPGLQAPARRCTLGEAYPRRGSHRHSQAVGRAVADAGARGALGAAARRGGGRRPTWSGDPGPDPPGKARRGSDNTVARSAPSSRWTWPAGATASRWSRAATPGSSRWRRRCWRWPRRRSTRTFRYGSCPGSPRPTRRRRAPAHLGHDYATISLSDRLKPWEVIAERLNAAASADLVLALYDPGSKSRTWQVAKARDLLPGAPLPGHPGRSGTGRRRPDGGRTYGTAGGRRPGGGGHADAADRGLVADALGAAGRFRRRPVHRVDPAPLPGA